MSPRHVRFHCLAFLAALSAACGGDDPTGPALDQPLVQLTTGIRHSCGLTATGAAYCWGWNRDGQLGDGTVQDRTTPVAVGGGLTFTSITAGAGHNCALTADGTAYCWGFNLSGQLGIGSTDSVPHFEPAQVAGDTRFASLDAGGGSYTCGLTAAGAAHCWGWNALGQLGDGSLTDRSSPVAVSTTETLLSLDAGVFHTCGVTAAQAVLCWGENDRGQLGIGTANDSLISTPQTVVSGVSFSSVTVGFQHTCGLDTAGDAYCWGRNSVGQSGTPGNNNNLTPTAVVAAGVSFSTLTAGASFTCGVTLTSRARCWGRNALGQLGHLSEDICSDLEGLLIGCTISPRDVETELRFTVVRLGAHHTCGVALSDNLAYCWGGGAVGELGNGQSGATYISIAPARVSGQVAGGG